MGGFRVVEPHENEDGGVIGLCRYSLSLSKIRLTHWELIP